MDTKHRLESAIFDQYLVVSETLEVQSSKFTDDGRQFVTMGVHLCLPHDERDVYRQTIRLRLLRLVEKRTNVVEGK